LFNNEASSHKKSNLYSKGDQSDNKNHTLVFSSTTTKMEYYDFKDINNSTGNDSLDQVIIITVASSISGILGFILLCCCCTAACSGWVDNCINGALSSNGDDDYGRVVLRRMQEEEERKKEDPEVRKEKLLNSFEKNKVSMVVSEDSFVHKVDALKGESKDLSTDSASSAGSTASVHSDVDEDHDDEDHKDHDVDKSNHSDNNDNENDINENAVIVKNASDVLDDIESGEPKEVYLPLSNSKGGKSTERRKIPNCCAVCLCSYDVGDTVVWSSNKNCQHAFHEECIVPWLTKNQSGECPCCRCPFTDLPAPDGKGNTESSPSVWSIRSWINRIRYTFVSQEE